MSLQPSAVWWSMSSMLFCWVTCISHIPNPESLCEILWFFGQLVSVGKLLWGSNQWKKWSPSGWLIRSRASAAKGALLAWLIGMWNAKRGVWQLSHLLWERPCEDWQGTLWLTQRYKGSVSEVYVRRLTYRFFMILPTGSQRSRSRRAFCSVTIFAHVLVFNAS